MISKLFTLVLMLSMIAGQSIAQQVFKPSADSKVIVEGTSSLHDWTSEATAIKGNAIIDLKDGKLENLKDVSVSIPVKNIKSGKSGMDKNTYTALKEKEHPEIKFAMDSYKNGKPGELSVKGKLTIAGSTKQIEMPVKYKVLSPSKISFEGSTSFKMSDFGIDPPTAMMGTIKTGDDVTISFLTTLIK